MASASRPNSGFFSLNENSRKVTKLAPDLFVSFNNALGTQIVNPVTTKPDSYKNADSTNAKTTNYSGGITSVSTSASVSPGSGTCTIQISTPMYEGMHTTYYITNPDGTKTSFFQPMTEVKVYAKGRFLTTALSGSSAADSNSPKYYVIFWGLVTGVNEQSSGATSNVTLSCKDMLSWWRYQSISVSTSAINTQYGGKTTAPTGTLLRFMNPWELIINMFSDTAFDNFMYPVWMGGNDHLPPLFPDYALSTDGSPGAMSMLTKHMGSYWQNRMQTLTRRSPSDVQLDQNSSGIEMFGMQGKLNLSNAFKLADADTLVNELPATRRGLSEKANLPTGDLPVDAAAAAAQAKPTLSSTPTDSQKAASKDTIDTTNKVLRLTQDMSLSADVTQDFGLIGKVMPYANLSENLPGPEASYRTKLEIAQSAVANTHMEFYQDVNGIFVFKPPFYNMDTSNTNTYRIRAEDIVSINESFETDNIINSVEVTGPILYLTTATQFAAAHFDFGSIDRFGQRFRTIKLPFGNNAKELQGLAVAEMSIANAQTTTASLEIPMRPEMRLGYPVYIDHLDCFYYVTSINHNLSFGSSATTSLTLSAKRPKVWDYSANPPEIMRAHIYRTVESLAKDKVPKGADEDQKAYENRIKEMARSMVSDSLNPNTKKGDAARKTDFSSTPTAKESSDRNFGLIATPNPGLYQAVPSQAYFSNNGPSSNAVKPGDKAGATRSLTELVNITEDSTPYTDVNGYLHIGGFPFGANLSINDNFTINDLTQLGTKDQPLDLLSVLHITPDNVANTKDDMAVENKQPPPAVYPPEPPKPDIKFGKNAVVQTLVKAGADTKNGEGTFEDGGTAATVNNRYAGSNRIFTIPELYNSKGQLAVNDNPVEESQ